MKNPDKQRAIELRMKGLTYDEIGKALGFTRQYAQQLVRPPIGIYNLIKNRAKGRCEDCKIALSNGHIHHRTLAAYDDYNDIANLMYLCVSCHQSAHMAMRQLSGGFTVKYGQKMENLSVRLSEQLMNQIIKISTEENRKPSEVMRSLIGEAIADRKREGIQQ